MPHQHTVFIENLLTLVITGLESIVHVVVYPTQTICKLEHLQEELRSAPSGKVDIELIVKTRPRIKENQMCANIFTLHTELYRCNNTGNTVSINKTSSNIEAAFLRTNSKSNLLKSFDIYSIPCRCSKVYMEPTGKQVNTRLKQQGCHVRNSNSGKLAAGEHRPDIGYSIGVNKTQIRREGGKILAKTPQRKKSNQ